MIRGGCEKKTHGWTSRAINGERRRHTDRAPHERDRDDAWRRCDRLRALRLAPLRLRNRRERDAGSNKPPGKKDGPSSRQPSPALVALLLGAAMVSNDEERAAAVDASVAAATDDTLRGVMDDLTPPG